MSKEGNGLQVGCEVLYINSCIYKIVSMDDNGDNMTIESEFEKYDNISKNDVTII